MLEGHARSMARVLQQLFERDQAIAQAEPNTKAQACRIGPAQHPRIRSGHNEPKNRGSSLPSLRAALNFNH